MKIALAQLNYTVGDFDGNTAKIIEAVNRAKGEAADLVVFDEDINIKEVFINGIKAQP